MTVELRPAYEWTCEECGRNNFASCLVLDMEPAELLELAKDHGYVDPSDTKVPDHFKGYDHVMPNTVTCMHCKSLYEPLNP